MTMLRLENGCTALKAQSPLTSGAIHIKGFPYPVGKFTNTSLPLRIFLLRIEVLNPKGRAYTRNGFNSCGVSSRFSSNARRLAKKLSNYPRRANKLNTATNQKHYQVYW